MRGTDRRIVFSRLFLLCLVLCTSAHALAQKPRDATIQTGGATVWQLAVSPDGKTLAYTSTNREGSIVLCDVKTGKEKDRFTLSTSDMRYLLSFNPDGKSVVVGVVGSKGLNTPGGIRVDVWDISKKKNVFQFDLGEGEGMRGLFTSDGKTLIVTSRLGGASLYDPTTGKRLGELKGKHAKTKFLAISSDDKWLATGHAPNVVTLWDLTRRSEVRTFELKQGKHKFEELTAITLSPRGDRLITSNNLGELLVWDTATGKVLARHAHYRGPRYNFLGFRSQGKTLVAAGADYEPAILLWNPTTDAQAGHPDIHIKKPPPTVDYKTAVLSPDGSVLATLDTGRRIQLWDLPADADLKKPEPEKLPKRNR